MLALDPPPKWLTFDCYGTLIQWDEGLLAAVEAILARHPGTAVDAATLIRIYDAHEHRLEQTPPHRSFKEVAAEGLKMAMEELGLPYEASDIATLTGRIPKMGPFPEVPAALAKLRARYPLCIISNTDDDLIAGNVANIGVPIDRVVSAQQAGAYKPSPAIFRHAHAQLGVSADEVVHICASPHLDLVACRDLGIRAIWINRRAGQTGIEDFTPLTELPDLSGVPDLLLP
jgi:2-haloacid dehalogenase